MTLYLLTASSFLCFLSHWNAYIAYSYIKTLSILYTNFVLLPSLTCSGNLFLYIDFHSSSVSAFYFFKISGFNIMVKYNYSFTKIFPHNFSDFLWFHILRLGFWTIWNLLWHKESSKELWNAICPIKPRKINHSLSDFCFHAYSWFFF